jgi:hypothetical protein
MSWTSCTLSVLAVVLALARTPNSSSAFTMFWRSKGPLHHRGHCWRRRGHADQTQQCLRTVPSAVCRRGQVPKIRANCSKLRKKKTRPVWPDEGGKRLALETCEETL